MPGKVRKVQSRVEPSRAAVFLRRGLMCWALLAGGCAVGPDYIRPDLGMPAGYLPGDEPPAVKNDAQRFVEVRGIPAQWWRVFGSDKINHLVEMAFAQNPSVGEAIAALEQARWNVRAQEGAFFPQVTGEWATTRQKMAAPEGSPPRFKGEIFTLHTPQVNVSFLPDVWGKNRRAVESLMSVADAQYYQLEATYLTLASNTVVAVIEEASLADQIAATRDIVNINKRILGLLDQEFKAGSASGLDVASQQAQLAQAESLLPPLEKAYDQQRNLIAVLTGNFPADANWKPTSLNALHLERELPVIVPSQLVDQRPDVRAAEAQVHAASAEIGVATANLLPQFGISGDVGSQARRLSDLFTPQSLVWSITGSIVQPIFQGGTLIAEKRAAEAAFMEAASVYRSTVLTAVQNVADVLRAIEADNNAVRAARAYEKASEKALNMVETELRAGQVAISVVLTSQQNYQQARLSVIQARALLFADVAALFQALGGGWWAGDPPGVLADAEWRGHIEPAP
jgi:NodT family efflux transporter outer membrane factor (OMF) lipoprotein